MTEMRKILTYFFAFISFCGLVRKTTEDLSLVNENVQHRKKEFEMWFEIRNLSQLFKSALEKKI